MQIGTRTRNINKDFTINPKETIATNIKINNAYIGAYLMINEFFIFIFLI